MPNVKTLQRSFAGGEVSPEMYGRIDDVKYQAGLKTCRNFIVKPTGPAANRPGTQFVREVKNSANPVRLISFTYSSTQTMVIELGAGYFRFHTNGGTVMDGLVPYEVANTYAASDLFDIHYVQSADVMTLVHPNYPPAELRRLGATNWTFTTISFTPTVTPPSVSVASNRKGYDYFYQYVVTSVASDNITESAASSPAQGVANNITSITNANPGVVATSYNHGLVVGNSLYISDVGGMVELNGNYYIVNTVPSSKTLTLADAAGNVIDTTNFTTYTTGGKLYQSGVKNNLFLTGAANTITWQPVAGAMRYNIYKFQGGVYGFIGSSDGSSFVDDNIAPDLSQTPPRYSSEFESAGNYPGAVSYFEQRRCFAGTTNAPQNIWMTKSGTESNLSYSIPVRDDDRIAVRVAAREANTIRHIVPLSQLMLLTSSAEWRVSSVNSDAITPTSISIKPQSYIGANNVQPVIINNNLIYCAARGGHVRECTYNWQANGFVTGDLSLRSAHLFDNYNVIDMAYSKAPEPMAWFVSSTGKLLGLTYIPEQQIGAWHQHDTDGVFESCAVVAEGNEDVLYVVVKRSINGSYKRYVERMAARNFVDQNDAFFVDCGLTYSGVPADTISGLTHLEGKTVSILADGAVHPQRVVTSGSVQLDIEASKVHVGLPIEADLETLPLAMQIDSAFGQGRYKNVNKAWLRVFRSSGIFVGPNADSLVEAKQRTTEPYGSAPELKSEEIQIMLTPSWADSGSVFVRQSDPLPLTIASLTLEVAVGG